MEHRYLGKPRDPGRSGTDNRRFVEALLWIASTGSPPLERPTARVQQVELGAQALLGMSQGRRVSSAV